MVKIKYVGDISPGRIKIAGNIYKVEKGQILEFDEKIVKKMALNKNYVRVDNIKVISSKPFKVEKKKEEKKDKEDE